MTLLPVFQTYFILDDLSVINLGPILRDQPLSFFTVTYMGWWRPLGFSVPGVIYLFFGLNPLPFHIIGYIVHLATAFALLLFVKRLINTNTAFVATAIYLISTASVATNGFVINAFQDELAAFCILLALFTALRVVPEKTIKHPYYISVLLLLIAAMCKQSWIGVLPALIYCDWINYSGQKLSIRMKRLWVYLMAILYLVLNFVFVAQENTIDTVTEAWRNVTNATNLIGGVSTAFIPQAAMWTDSLWLYGGFLLAVLITVFALINTKIDRRRSFVLFLALIGLLLVTGMATLIPNPYGYTMAWLHLTPMVAIAACLLAICVNNVSKVIDHSVLGWLSSWLVLILLFSLSIETRAMVVNEVNLNSHRTHSTLRAFKEQILSIGNEYKIYVLCNKSGMENLLYDLVVETDIEFLFIHEKVKHNLYRGLNKQPYVHHYKVDDLVRLLDRETTTGKAKVLGYYEGRPWVDITNRYPQAIVRMGTR